MEEKHKMFHLQRRLLFLFMKDVVKVRKLGISSGTHHKSSERKENSSETTSRSSERKAKSSERGSETKDLIIDIIKQNPHITAAEIAMEIDMSSRGVEKQIKKLREAGIIKRNGADFGGYWEIIISDNNNAAKD